jgi:hypothetical protein
MKTVILKVAASLGVVVASLAGFMLAVYARAALPWGPFDNGYIWFPILPVLGLWAVASGGISAAVWNSIRRHSPATSFLMALLAWILVLGPAVWLLAATPDGIWSHEYGTLVRRIVALGYVSLLPSQIAFWGFVLVTRIGFAKR